MWYVNGKSRQLDPLHGVYDTIGTRHDYIHVESEASIELSRAIKRIKDEPPLRQTQPELSGRRVWVSYYASRAQRRYEVPAGSKPDLVLPWRSWNTGRRSKQPLDGYSGG